MMMENEHSLDFYVLKIFLTFHWKLDPSVKLYAQRIVPKSSTFQECCMSRPVELSFPSPPANYRSSAFTQSKLIGTVSHYFIGFGGKHIFSLRDLRQEYLTVKPESKHPMCSLLCSSGVYWRKRWLHETTDPLWTFLISLSGYISFLLAMQLYSMAFYSKEPQIFFAYVSQIRSVLILCTGRVQEHI